jgi:hypothetical protein
MRWERNVAIWGRGKMYTGFWWGNVKEREFLEDPSIDGKVILRWICRKWDEGAWTGLIWLRTEIFGSTCKHGNEPSGSIKCGEYLD